MLPLAGDCGNKVQLQPFHRNRVFGFLVTPHPSVVEIMSMWYHCQLPSRHRLKPCRCRPVGDSRECRLDSPNSSKSRHWPGWYLSPQMRTGPRLLPCRARRLSRPGTPSTAGRGEGVHEMRRDVGVSWYPPGAFGTVSPGLSQFYGRSIPVPPGSRPCYRCSTTNLAACNSFFLRNIIALDRPEPGILLLRQLLAELVGRCRRRSWSGAALPGRRRGRPDAGPRLRAWHSGSR